MRRCLPCARSALSSASSSSSAAPLCLYPDPILRVKCSAVQSAASAAGLVASLKATAAAHHGLGLAAPQIGASQRAFVLLQPLAWNDKEARRLSLAMRSRAADSLQRLRFVACLNPSILHKSSEEAVGVETCLSIPDVPALVRRARRITVRYEDEEGAAVEQELSGLPAIVFQHELDHLDGVLLIDRDVQPIMGETQQDAMSAAHQAFLLGSSRYYGVHR